MPSSESLTEAVSTAVDETREKSDGYDRWMLMEKRSRKKSTDSANLGSRIMEKKNEGSCLMALTEKEGPSRSSNNADGLDNGLVSSSNMVINPRTTFKGVFKGLRESSLLKDSTSGQKKGSNSGPSENKIMAVLDRVMKVSSKLIRNLVAFRNQGRIADGGNDGSDSHSHIDGDRNKSENMEQARLPSKRVVDITVSKTDDGLDFCRHWTVTFKEPQGAFTGN
ncbi:hypothetical protein J1N35_007419 [Gossypium stocksii]|uniref:Uncharacterized protein n=1 Tax=Gossypium stocksii TaxID=47602 RepID=A0A9D3W6L9_9ROSI|nr:hypothetical protein J1N35_007419 [Gossypium stocksii]